MRCFVLIDVVAGLDVFVSSDIVVDLEAVVSIDVVVGENFFLPAFT